MSTRNLRDYIDMMNTLREKRRSGEVPREWYGKLTGPFDDLDLTEEENALVLQITWRGHPEVFDAVMADDPTYIEIDPFEHEGMPPRLQVCPEWWVKYAHLIRRSPS